MSRYPRGSEWRKWDLHVHAPGTKLNDCYAKKSGNTDLTRFCEIVHDSGVAVVGIADYFSFDGYFTVKERYAELYSEDSVLFIPNLELRLPFAVNRDVQEVNLHLIFRPTLTRAEANKFLDRLNTLGTTGPNSRAVSCAELATQDDFKSATVSPAGIDEAIRASFGEHAAVRSARQEHLLVVASAKGDGIRPGGSGVERKRLLTDEIDKYSDAFFANSGSRDYFLRTDRLENCDAIVPKPVFDGCDAHSFDDLQSGLGKHVSTEGRKRNITWIKADPTYAGLLQTLVEPSERVSIQVTAPDQKEPYKVISSVRFTGTEDFPEEVVFNRNLTAIIGSRSSGKSALLAHVAHAVDPVETVRLQVEAHGLGDRKDAGPAAGYTWDDVAGVACEVIWESGGPATGKVIFVPQNSLYRLAEQPDEITRKIVPALFRAYPALKTAYDSAMSRVGVANAEIRRGVEEWYSLAGRADLHAQQLRDLGDKAAISAERDRLQGEINVIRTAAQLTDSEVAQYQEVAGKLSGFESTLRSIESSLDRLSPYVSRDGETHPGTIEVSIAVRPAVGDIPDAVAAQIDRIRADAETSVTSNVEVALADAAAALDAEGASVREFLRLTKAEHAELIAKHEANEELSGVVADHEKQVARLNDISRMEESLRSVKVGQEGAVAKVVGGIAERTSALAALTATFVAEGRSLRELTFGVETGVPTEAVERASQGFSQRSTNDYIKNKGDLVAYAVAQGDPGAFLRALRSGKVTLNKRFDPQSVAAEVLTVAEEVRFTASLDGDGIGGFGKSSMTPGKQALFALTLILNESQEPWPLLIDQPEDDLDSRSIYDTIVPYLMARKKERQIIMVSHNANLVIGADSEQVIVANRHGDDRRNAGARTFEYLSGALENSQAHDAQSKTALGRFGLREHACEVLDGGEEAFQKRRNKYKI